jgi:hypothetical protein
MLIVVRDNDTASSLAARRAELDAELAVIAAAPVRHVPAEFLLAVQGLFPELAAPPTRRTVAR